MQMPIVTRRKMSMCESVAATCCYRIVVSPSNYYYETLHGGIVEAGDLPVFSENIMPEWAQLDFDVDFSNYAGDTPVPYSHPLLQGWWVLFMDNGVITRTSPMEDFLGDPGAQLTVVNEGCGHYHRGCLYVTHQNNPQSHINATEPHLYGGDHFARPHEARQFTS